MFSTAIFSGSCSQPILESPGCSEARDYVKRLYSIHLDQGPNPDREKLKSIRHYLSDELFDELSQSNRKDTDYLTQYAEFPKAFRVGTCYDTAGGPEFDVLLFWRRDEKNFEEEIVVSAAKENDWVVKRVRKGIK